MNSRAASVSLLIVTGLLLGAVAYMAWVISRDSSALVDMRTASITNTVTQITVRKINATNLLAAFANRPVNWAGLESTNYASYIANLRAFGCPEETVRDIILTDIAKLYARRRAQAAAALQPYRYWRTADPGGGNNPELRRRLRSLDLERRTLVRDLLGVDFNTEMAKYGIDDRIALGADDYLPETKQGEVKEIVQRYDDLEEDILVQSRGIVLDEDQEALRQLRSKREAELATVLDPEELEEYQLRHSETAESLRSQLSGFELSEEEFRKVFRLHKVFDDDFNNAFELTDENAMATRARAQQEAQRAMEDELKQTLGSDRFNEYQRASDPDYRTLVQLAERYEVSPAIAARAFDMKSEALSQVRAIQSNANLTEAQRQAALTAIANTTQKVLSEVLPPKLYKAYQKNGSQWIDDLTQPEPAGPQ